MTAKIIDASALAAVVFQEGEEEKVLQRLHGHDLCAPALLRFEIANVCVKKSRAQPDQREAFQAMHAKSLDVPIRLYDVSQPEIVELAMTMKLSAYDASYLWLSRKLGAELVTLDERLERAAAKP